jgi:hypothetical protein
MSLPPVTERQPRNFYTTKNCLQLLNWLINRLILNKSYNQDGVVQSQEGYFAFLPMKRSSREEERTEKIPCWAERNSSTVKKAFG